MIQTFDHKGLKLFFETGSTKGIKAAHAKKLAAILQRLDAAEEIQDMNFHGSRLHALQGKMKGLWSVTVNGNWRIIFRFEDGDAYVVDYLDYH